METPGMRSARTRRVLAAGQFLGSLLCLVAIYYGTQTHAQSQPARSADDNWDGRFALSGLKSFAGSGYGARAVAYMGTNLYVGGSFDAVGQTRANSIAKWDGSRWQPLAEGILTGYASGTAQGFVGTAFAIAAQGTNLYVGGAFKIAGEQYANGIARWDGAAWHALGAGISNGVQDKNGVASEVTALLVVGSDLYVGGVFARAGGIASPGIAKWNGATWSPVGGGIYSSFGGTDPGTVKALAWDGQNIYVGGTFGMAGSSSVANIAKWDGSAWSSLATGLIGNNSSAFLRTEVRSLAVLGTNVYASGYFNLAGPYNSQVAAPGFAKWNGTQWSSARQTTDGGALLVSYFPDHSTVGDYGAGPLIIVSNQLYMAGSFAYTNGSYKSGLASLATSSEWNVLGSGIGSEFTDERRLALGQLLPLQAIASDGTRIVIGGLFSRLDEESAAGLVQWDGQRLSPLNDGGGFGLYLNWGSCSQLAANGTNLFAAIDNQPGGVLVNGVARWDGSRWSKLGDGVTQVNDFNSIISPGTVRALAPDGGVLYVGGKFSFAGSEYANNVAKWDGTNWSALGNGTKNGVTYPSVSGFLLDGSPVHAIATSGTNVYVAGEFNRAGGLVVNSIAKWDGNNWSSLGSGLVRSGWPVGAATSMAVGSDGLYVGGHFDHAGGVASADVARWDGVAWRSLNGGVDSDLSYSRVEAVQAHQGEIFVAGHFSSIGSVSAGGVAKWNGTSWVGFPGMASLSGNSIWNLERAWGIAFDGDDLYVGARFLGPNGWSEPLLGVAKWTSNGWVILGRGFNVPSAGGEFVIAVAGKSLYAGGTFQTAGNKLSYGFARYNLALDFTRPWIDLVQSLPGGSVEFSAVNVNAASAFLEATTDFSQWTRVATNTATGGSVILNDSSATTFPRRFYRVALP